MNIYTPNHLSFYLSIIFLDTFQSCIYSYLPHLDSCKSFEESPFIFDIVCVQNAVHKITAGHLSLSSMISCVTDRIRFLLVTVSGRFSNFNSTSYTEDRHELRVTGTKCRLLDMMSDTGKIFISDAKVECQNDITVDILTYL